MKKLVFLLMLSAWSTASLFSQNSIKEKTSVEIGKILDFKVSVLTSKDLSNSSTDNKLVLETKSFAAADVRVVELSKSEVETIIATIGTLNSEYLSKTRTSAIEVSYLTSKGFELGAYFELVVEKTTGTPTTKKEKYYVDTKEKYYEGKIVNSDQAGTFIWKEVQSTTVKEPTGKWVPFVRLNNSTSKNTTTISVDELNAFAKFLTENSSKL
jgi:hypothetical protein